MAEAPAAESRLVPYLPRLAIQWAAEDPSATTREVDGSLVFVDISGFTKMSERLARHGKVGAEEVTDILGAVFTRLLAVAYAEGAGLLKFGGDALLLWFSGDEHAVRAARSAHGMRATLRSIGALETTAGKVTLRMSIGVNSGRFHFFLVGKSHRELIITGPAATETVRMESAATAGEILLSPTTATLLADRILGEAKGPGRLLRSAPSGLSLEGSAMDLPDTVPDLLPYIPVGLRESILAGTEPEHRSATIAFIHFDGTDALIEGEGPEAAAVALEELVCDVQEAVDTQGVCFLASDADADGGKLILTAGVPRMVGDDEERMLLALRQIVERERRLPIRIGVNRGPVFSGDVGPAYRRTYTVMGDPVNLAARLMAKAAPGHVLATAGVLDRSATRFELAELEPFTVKGKTRPVHAWSVGPRIGRPKHTAAQEYPLLGRDEELDLLTSAQDLARAGRRRTIVITGEAGLGKTRLLDEVLERSPDFEVFGATGESFTSTTPYVAWRDVLREMIGAGWDDPSATVVARLRSLVEAHEPALLPWLPLIATAADAEAEPTPEVAALGPEYRRPRLHQAVIGLLRAIRTTPTLFAFEDAQLMDEASADLLQAIATDERDDRPWLILALRRPEGDGFDPPAGPTVTALDLQPLELDGSRILAVLATDDAPLPEHLLLETIERAGGNPQLLLDLILAARSGEGSLPGSVEAAATVRIDSLTPRDRQLVRRVSVFGLAFHPRFLPDVFDESAPMPDERTWERLAEFFEPEGGGYLRFRRAVIRDAAYSGLPFRTRQRLHVAVGSHFEREAAHPEEIAGLLSLHFSLGADHERAWRYAEVAATHAAGIFANVEAAILYRRALDAARASGVVPAAVMAAVAESRADVLYMAGEFRGAAQSLDGARRLVAGDALGEARLLLKRSRIEEKLGRYSQALRWATRARRALERLEGLEAARERAQQSAWYATVLQAQGRSRDAVAWAERAIAEATAAGDLDALARAYNALDWSNLQLGRPTGDAWPRALAIYEEQGDLAGQARILSNLGMEAFYAGRWDEALGFAERGRDIELRIGNFVGAATDASNIAELRCEQGAYDEAEAQLRDALRVARAAGHRWGVGLATSILALVLARTGRFDDALDLFAQAASELNAIGATEDALLNDARLAECHVLTGDAAAALRIVADTLREGAAPGGISMAVSQLERIRGYALIQTGSTPEARLAFERSLEAARARDDLLQTALTLVALARLDRWEGGPVDDEVNAEATTSLERLGIRRVPEPPLPGGASR